MSDAAKPEKKKRKPGPRPKAVHYKSLSITLPPADMDRLLEQVMQTGRSRSELLRRAWRGLPLTPLVKRGVLTVALYRQLIKLVRNLEELVSTDEFGPAIQGQAQVTLGQIQRFISVLNEGDTQ
ncbi:hypothetical protein A0257_22390 (plasmid) [Hymenobacter psoromatis]|nr:hypothetical protein A0257_22390 [Hymenobacter psoromatis]